MSLAVFLEAWAETGLAEGGYVDNPHDSGGPTNFGITEHVARANGYTGDMRKLPKSEATRIAKLQYWDPLRLDEICQINDEIAREVFDSGILHGISRSGKWLQQALNAFNRSHKTTADYPELVEDGIIGPKTFLAMRAFLARRGEAGERVLLKALNALQGSFMLELVKRREKDEEFIFGWFHHRVVI